MGVPGEIARGAVRVSLGSGSTERQVEDFLRTLRETAKKLQHLTAIAV
jgi:cysteine desulfurase